MSGRKGGRLPRGEGSKRAEQLIEAADRLLTERGAEDAVSVGDIVGAIGITPPVLYRHFADKRALFRRVYERRFASFRTHVQAAANQATTPDAALLARGLAYLEYASAHPTYYRALFLDSESLVSEIFGDEEARRQSPYQDLADNIGACIEAGVFAADTDVTVVSMTIWSMVHGVTALAITLEQQALVAPLRDSLEFGLATLMVGLRAGSEPQGS